MGDLAAALTVGQGEGRTGGVDRFCDLECLSISFNGDGVTVQTERDIFYYLDATELGVRWGLQNEVGGKVVGALRQRTLIGQFLWFAADLHFTVIVLPDRRRKGGLVGLIMAAHMVARLSIAAEVVGVRCRRFRLAIRECRRRQQRQAQGQRQKQAQSSFFIFSCLFCQNFLAGKARQTLAFDLR